MAKIAKAQRRLMVSSIAFIMAAVMMMPTTTDARGGGGGHGGGGHGGGAHFGLASKGHTAVPRPIQLQRRFGSSSRHVASSNTSFWHHHRSFNRSRRIGSHFLTLGADGIWVDNFVYTPTMLVMQPSALTSEQTPRHASVIRTPGPAHAGILVVRGDSKSYVTFPAATRG